MGDQVWVTRDEMRRYCPPCAERMEAANISRIALRDAQAWAAYEDRDTESICASIWSAGSDEHRVAFGELAQREEWMGRCRESVGGVDYQVAAADALQRGAGPGPEADYGRGEPCKKGERADTTGCVPSKAESGEGRGVGSEAAESERLADLGQRMDEVNRITDDLAEIAAGGSFGPRDREVFEGNLQRLGMDRQQAQGLVDAIAGKPDLAGKVARFAGNYAANIKQQVRLNFDRFVDTQVRSGVPIGVARAVALGSAIFAGSPASITTGMSAAGLIGAWGATPGLGALEGLAIVGSVSAGARAVRGFTRVSKRVLQATGRFSAGETLWIYQDDQVRAIDPVALGQAVAEQLPEGDAERRAYVRALLLLLMGGADQSPAEFAAGARQIVDAAEPDELEDLASVEQVGDQAEAFAASAGALAYDAGQPQATGQVHAPPVRFRADQNEDGTWNLRGVPVFVEHDVREKTGGKQSYRVDRNWMEEAVRKSQERYRDDGYLAPLHENHHGRGRDVRLVGRYLLTGVKRMPYQGRPLDVIFADYLRVQPETYKRIKQGELPYRSAEVMRLANKELDSIALLSDEVPFFRLAPHEVGDEQPHPDAPGPQRFSASWAPLIAYRASGHLSYSLLMRYDDMPDVEERPEVEVPGAAEEAEEKHMEGGGVIGVLSEMARLIEEALEAAKAGGAPEAEHSEAPAPVDLKPDEMPEEASAMRSAGTPALIYQLQAKVDAAEAKTAAIEQRLNAERAAKDRAGAVDKTMAELQQYGFGTPKHRARLEEIAAKGGNEGLQIYAEAVKESWAEAPPSLEYLSGGGAGGTAERPRSTRPDPGAEKYSALGPEAVELAYKAGRDFDALKAKGTGLGMTRDEFIALTLEGEGNYQLTAEAAG